MPSMFISSMWDAKEPTQHEVPGVVAVLCECMGGYREGDMPCMGLSVPFTYHLELLCKSCRIKKTFDPLQRWKMRAWELGAFGLPLVMACFFVLCISLRRRKFLWDWPVCGFILEPYSVREARIHLRRIKDLMSTNFQVNAYSAVDHLSLSFLSPVAGVDVEGRIRVIFRTVYFFCFFNVVNIIIVIYRRSCAY